MVKEYENLKSNYLVEIEDPRVIDILREIHTAPKRSILRTPWYNILSNHTYNEAFFYIGAHIAEREKLIKDVNEDQDNHCEQSDIVNVLLNLGNIPDVVASHFNFKPGFQTAFKRSMEEYRAKFKQVHGVQWSYMTPKVVQKYLEFKEKQDAKYMKE